MRYIKLLLLVLTLSFVLTACFGGSQYGTLVMIYDKKDSNRSVLITVNANGYPNYNYFVDTIDRKFTDSLKSKYGLVIKYTLDINRNVTDVQVIGGVANEIKDSP